LISQKDVLTGDTLLHYATFENKSAFIEGILDYFANEINQKNEDGNTALSYACLRGNLKIVKLLHMKGADLDTRNAALLTPLHLATYNAHFFVVHYLLSIDNVIRAVSPTQELYRLLQFAISSLSFQIFSLLIEVFAERIEDIQDNH